MTQEELKAALTSRIEELNKQRDNFVTEANQQISAFSGAIQEAQHTLDLLSPPELKPE